MNARPRTWVLALASALFAVMLVLRLFVGDEDEPGAVVFAPPVALFALELGALPGAVAGAVATGAFYLTVADVSVWDLAFRGASLVGLGALVGGLGSRLRAAREAARTARDINDNVIQSLVLAKYALDRRDLAEANARVDETLGEARQIVEGLVRTGDVRGGALRRDAPARVR